MKQLLRGLASPCAALSIAAAMLIAASPRAAHADSGRLNLHLEAGAGLPVTSYIAPPGKNDHTASWGVGGWLSIDLPLFGPIALEAIGGGGRLFGTIDDNPDIVGGRNPSGYSFYMGGGGLRIRLFDDKKGYRGEPNGSGAGSLWVSAHVHYQHLIENQLGMDAALGYDWSVARPFSFGVFARTMIGFNAPGRPWVAGEEQTTVAVFGGLSASFELIQRKQMEEAVTPPPPAPADSDHDGILDSSDACPTDAEDIDGFQDQDGCPDTDNDGDGIADTADQCPAEAEDIDGFQDGDGCPDRDNDGDGVADADDRCPTQAGIAELQGCPDPDGDNDGVPDRFDNCPTEPGTVENHGCAARQLVTMTGNRLEILEKVMFRTGSATIDRRSFGLLTNVAQVLNNHPEIAQVRVEGHTDSRGNAARNVTLSQKRAQAVVNYLVRTGHVDAGRLTALGQGSNVPVVANAATEEEFEQNRRVEFHVVVPPTQ